jgi:hypothetical protein
LVLNAKPDKKQTGARAKGANELKILGWRVFAFYDVLVIEA